MTDNELNALVAEKVMGQHRVGDCPLGDSSCMGKYEPMVNGRPCLPDYANDIAAAWQVWERMKTSTVWAEFCDALSRGEYYKTMAMIYPKTICLAALEAMGKVFAVAAEAEGKLYFGDTGGGTEWEKEQWAHFAKGLSYRSY